MYRQSHSHFERPSFKISSLPENYSGNAFQREEEPLTSEKIEQAENRSPERKEPEPLLERMLERTGRLHEVKSDSALLFLVLLILAAGGGEKDDGVMLMVLILLLL